MDSSAYLSRFRVILLCAFSALVAFLGVAHAQDGLGPLSTGSDEVQLSVNSFGVGGLAREGEWAGIQVQLLDTSSSSRDIILRIEIPDEDGDLTQFERVVSANPGVLQSFWLYCRLPFRSIGSEFVLKAFEAVDSGSDTGEGGGFDAGRLLGQIPIINPAIQPSTIGLIGVIGSHQLSLEQYGYTMNNREWMLFGHELERTSPGLGIENLPDRWQGLAGLDTIVWSSTSTANFDPSRLTPEKARALREWVTRGGHLVIVMQSSGDPWYLGAHPLRSMLPEISVPQRHEGVSLEPFRTLLTESAQVQLPEQAVVYTFTPSGDAAFGEAIPVLQGRDGESVVIRRLLGSGMVTLVGLPLNHGQLRRVGLPDPEAFWHRVLGLRGDILRPDQMSDQQKTDVTNRSPLLFDEGVSGSISKTGTAIQGVFFGIVVFILYWLIAGPLGYAMLKGRKMTHHAWLGFVLSIGAFTALAWIGATVMRPKKTTISHLTLLEQVHGQDSQRARSWFSVMLPSYGEAKLSVTGPDDGSGFGLQDDPNILTPWSSPDLTGVLSSGFPDNSGYRIQSKAPNQVWVPTRATVKTFTSDWSGTSDWSMPEPVQVPGSLEESRLQVSGLIVSGEIVHNLPGALHDVLVVVNSREAPINRVGQKLGRRMIAQTMVYTPDFGPGGWRPGEAVDLAPITTIKAAERRRAMSDYFSTAVRYGVDRSGLTSTRGTLTDRLVAGRFLSQFEPPRFGASQSDPVGNRLAHRRMLHGWDLGRWFTQPSVIVIGVLEVDSDHATADGIPFPVYVNGRRVPSSGKTIVCWVYPLEPSPPEYLDKSPEVRDESETNGDKQGG